MFRVVQSETAIENLENAAMQGVNDGTYFRGMSYEQGITDTLRWLQDKADPLLDELQQMISEEDKPEDDEIFYPNWGDLT